MLRNADVAKMLPCVPAAMTATEATKTMKSAGAGMAMSRLGPGTHPPRVGIPSSEVPWVVGAVAGIGRVRCVCQRPGSGPGMRSACQPWGSGSRIGGVGTGPITDDTEGFSGKAEAALPSSVAAAAPSRPDADDVLQTKHHDHHKFLWGQVALSRTQAQVREPRNSPGLGVLGFHETTSPGSSYTWTNLKRQAGPSKEADSPNLSSLLSP